MSTTGSTRQQSEADPVGLGGAIRAAREGLGLSARGLAAQLGVHHTYVTRLEAAEYRTIRPEMLSRLSRALEIDERDLFAMAGMDAPEGLPSFAPYLRAKYQITAPALKAMEEYWSFVQDRYQIEPRPELVRPPEPSPAPSPASQSHTASVEPSPKTPVLRPDSDLRLDPAMKAVLGISEQGDNPDELKPENELRSDADDAIQSPLKDGSRNGS